MVRLRGTAGLVPLVLLAGCGTLVFDQKALDAALPQRVAILPFLLALEDPGE